MTASSNLLRSPVSPPESSCRATPNPDISEELAYLPTPNSSRRATASPQPPAHLQPSSLTPATLAFTVPPAPSPGPVFVKAPRHSPMVTNLIGTVNDMTKPFISSLEQEIMALRKNLFQHLHKERMRSLFYQKLAAEEKKRRQKAEHELNEILRIIQHKVASTPNSSHDPIALEILEQQIKKEEARNDNGTLPSKRRRVD